MVPTPVPAVVPGTSVHSSSLYCDVESGLVVVVTVLLVEPAYDVSEPCVPMDWENTASAFAAFVKETRLPVAEELVGWRTMNMDTPLFRLA